MGLIPQIRELKKGADIIIACRGRGIDHIQRGNVDFSCRDALVVDEADQMLDMGFIPDIRRILKHIPRHRQTLMSNAPFLLLADRILYDQEAATSPKVV